MSRYDARLVAWLVQHHLLLSLTAQKKDLNDPNVVNEFARTVGDQTHLDYLYVLTVADVRGTNPKIWNSWKDTLFCGALSVDAPRAAPRRAESDRQRGADPRPADPGRASCCCRRDSTARALAADLVELHRRVFPAPSARGDRVAHARARRERRTRLDHRRRQRRRSSRAYGRSRCTRPRRRARSCARRPCSTSSGSRSSTRASCRSPTGRASTPTACSRATAARSPTGAGSTRSGIACSRR